MAGSMVAMSSLASCKDSSCYRPISYEEFVQFYQNQQKINELAKEAFRGQQERVANLEQGFRGVNSSIEELKRKNRAIEAKLRALQAASSGGRKGSNKRCDEESSSSDEEDTEYICQNCRNVIRRILHMIEEE